MNTLNQKLCIHTTLLFVALVGGGFVVAGWVPPPSPAGSAEQIAANVTDQDKVRIAAAMFFFGASFFAFPAVAITAQLKRIEGPRHVLANAQMLVAAIGVLAIQIPAVLWLALSYYDGTDPEIVKVLNAMAWFLLLGAVGPAVMQNVAIGLCVLGSDGSVYPRWIGYLNLYCGTGLMAGVLIPFFDHGPFAWNGVVGFWVVATDFFVWVFVMWIYTVRAIDAEASVQSVEAAFLVPAASP